MRTFSGKGRCTKMQHPVGSLVRCREREWVVLPSKDEALLMLRPLGGSESEETGIYLPLHLEEIDRATFALPNPRTAGDHTAGGLLRDAARLGFRSGAGPFRSLGRISVRPRPYQLVPLLMALRQEYARLLIADDVGIGKTVEAGLIARELLDRGEATGLCVVCPPHLCDQWQKELAEKFHIPAVIIRSSTIGQLDRLLPGQHISVFEHFRHQIVSVDFVKADRWRPAFLQHCPDLVIVDEAHTCARPGGRSTAQQLRHQLIAELAKTGERHLLLLTATPHSGVESSFLSLLGLINQRFASLDLTALTDREREALARHFLQRRRADIRNWLDEETPFPKRVPTEIEYSLSPAYRQLFDDVFAFAREQVRSAETLSGFRQRVRYWAALALLRSVMSSPASAQAALLRRATGTKDEAEDAEAELSGATEVVYDPLGEADSDDVTPAHLVQAGDAVMPAVDKTRLREFARRADALKGDEDHKLAALTDQVTQLLEEGYHPIVYCRYIATADYVAQELGRRLRSRWPNLHVISVTGEQAEDEREARVRELAESSKRIMVATDCLSEGVNLQHAFDAVLHYDLPWNPNRLEQREGRVDRYGQKTKVVKAILLYGRDNEIDLAVLDVLLRKARLIHDTLGITVPLPINSEDVMTAVVRSLFKRAEARPEKPAFKQLTLADLEEDNVHSVETLHKRWDRAVDDEKLSRTRFAHHAIKPDEVASELRETDAVLGDPQAVENFLRSALERLGAPLERTATAWRLNPVRLPAAIRERLGASKTLLICLDSTVDEQAVYVGRQHPLTAAVAEYLLDQALDNGQMAPHASRCGVTRTDMVQGRTTLMLLRVRFLLERRGIAPVLAEEAVVCGYRGTPENCEWLTEQESLALLAEAKPRENLSPQQREQILAPALGWLDSLRPAIDQVAADRARRLHEAHQRVRRVLVGRSDRVSQLTVRPQTPVDVLGLYVLMPLPKGVRS